MQPFRYVRPTCLDEACATLAGDPAARALCGGTDLLVGLRHGTIDASQVVDVKALPELRTVSVEPGSVRLGAAVPLTELMAHPVVAREFPALAEAMAVVGSIQIRNRATLGGNIANASPAADTVPALLVHRARVHLAGPAGTRSLPLSEVITGPRRTALQPGEIITAVDIPRTGRRQPGAFARMTRRRGVDLASVNVAAVVHESQLTLAAGAVAPTVVVVSGPQESAGELISRLTSKITPIDDIRAGAEYRRSMVSVLAHRAVAHLSRNGSQNNQLQENDQ